jgi:hypothetical protein
MPVLVDEAMIKPQSGFILNFVNKGLAVEFTIEEIPLLEFNGRYNVYMIKK